MSSMRTKKKIFFFAVLILLMGVCAYLLIDENKEYQCLSVPVLSMQEIGEYHRSEDVDLSKEITFYGQPAAIDRDEAKIYIPQNIGKYTVPGTMEGKLQCLNPEYTLYFAPDEKFKDMDAAISEGHVFRLLAVKEDKTYMEYGVVFTTLPVVHMNGEFSYVNEDQRDVLKGDMCLWASDDPGLGRYTVKSGQLEWHLRGATSSEPAKKPWKISMKDELGANKNIEFLGLGEDDDWILNPMNMDDTRVKERLFMDMWNEVSDRDRYNFNMSKGEYVEVVINGEYWGLYLMQRRIDPKYLELQADDILIRGRRLLEMPKTVDEAYEIKYSPYDDEYTYSVMYGTYQGSDVSIVDVNAFIDVNLFIQFAIAHDNGGYNNIYVVIEKENEGFRLRFLPWDTDMSFGGFNFDIESSITTYIKRFETYNMGRLHENLNQLTAERWMKLRKNTFTRKQIYAYLDSYYEEMEKGHSYSRDKKKWGNRFNGKDTIESMRYYIDKRLQWMDEYYAQYLQ